MHRHFATLILLLSLTACDAQSIADTCNAQCDQLKILARRGDASAQTQLGLMYFRGTDVPKDDVEAVSLWNKAAAQDYAPAEEWLAQAYSCGVGGLKPDQAKAAQLREKAKKDSSAENDTDNKIMRPVGASH